MTFSISDTTQYAVAPTQRRCHSCVTVKTVVMQKDSCVNVILNLFLVIYERKFITNSYQIFKNKKDN